MAKSKRKYNKPLDPLRKELKVLVKEANERVSQLIKNNYASRAYNEATRTLAPSRRDDNVLFRSDLKNRRQLTREFARVNKFLNDWTSLSEGAEEFSSEFYTMKGVWGGQFGEDHFDASKLDADFAKKAFEIYDRVIEAKGGWDRVIGFFRDENSKVQFGSEVLLNAIYDMSIQGFSDEEILIRSEALVDQAIQSFDKMAVLQRTNIDYGSVIPNEDKRADYYKWRKSRSKATWHEFKHNRHYRRRK